MGTDVATDVSVRAVFEEALVDATVTTSSFTVDRAEGGPVDGAVSVDSGQTAVFAPDQSLALLTPYMATLSTGIEGLSGDHLAEDFVWGFTTRDGGWGAAELIETDDLGDASNPQIAIDSTGNALAVWHQSDGMRDNIWSNRHTPSGGWGTAELIETDDAGNARWPEIAIDPDGNAITVWYQSDGTRDNIWSNRYAPSSGWDTAELIETDNAGRAGRPHVAIDSNGNALAVWVQSNGTRFSLWSNRYTPSGSWGMPELIETDDAGNTNYPRIAFDPAGNALAVWYQSDGTRDNIWSNRYTSGVGWGTAELIETDDAGDAQLPEIAIDPNGNALSVWYQSDGSVFNIWSNRYTPSGGWGTAELIETYNADHATSPHVAVDVKGNALAVWEQSDGAYRSVWSNGYTPSGGWGTAARIDAGTLTSARSARVAFDPSGNALAVWGQELGPQNDIWSNRYSSSEGWGTAERIEIDGAGSAHSPQIAVDSAGNAQAIWDQAEGTRDDIWVNRFE
jgi:hypothetical protein